MYADTFSAAFSLFAACEIPNAENLRPYVSPLFVSKLMKLYFKKCNERKVISKSTQGKRKFKCRGKIHAVIKTHYCPQVPAGKPRLDNYLRISLGLKKNCLTDRLDIPWLF